MKSIEDRIKFIIHDKFNIDEKDITHDKTFVEFGADSLDGVELMMEFEKEFNITIPDDEMEKIKTVGNIISYIETRILCNKLKIIEN